MDRIILIFGVLAMMAAIFAIGYGMANMLMILFELAKMQVIPL